MIMIMIIIMIIIVGTVEVELCFQPFLSRDTVLDRMSKSRASSLDLSHSDLSAGTEEACSAADGNNMYSDSPSSSGRASPGVSFAHAETTPSLSRHSSLPLSPPMFRRVLTGGPDSAPLKRTKTGISMMDLQRSNTMGGYLLVTGLRANNLKIADRTSSDPYLILKVGKTTHKSKVKKRTLNPIWKSSFKFRISDPINETLQIQVRYYNHYSPSDE
jgi:hypothetical protein